MFEDVQQLFYFQHNGFSQFKTSQIKTKELTKCSSVKHHLNTL